MIPFNLRTEYFSQPLGLDVVRPRFAWQLPAARRGLSQSAYQIQVASDRGSLVRDEEPDLWDSDRVESDASLHVPYGGRELQSRMSCFWRVKFWDEKGQSSDWSEINSWEMALLQPEDWKAKWIQSLIVGGPKVSPAVPALRRAFDLPEKSVARARLYVSALGLHETYLNGQRIGLEAFSPGWTDYRKTIQYRTYDVTGFLRAGENCLATLLGDGWFCGVTGNFDKRQYYGDRPAFLAQLEVFFQDGSRQDLTTDAEWKTTASPIVSSDFFMGESYDARLELGAWTMPGYEDGAWSTVGLREKPTGQLRVSASPPVRPIMELKPVAEPVRFGPSYAGKTFVYDLGQNMVGVARFRFRGQRGQTVTIRYAEILNRDGTVYTDNLRSAKSTDYYTFKSDQEETYQPHFTFHGFRYVEIGAFEQSPGIDAVTGIVLHSDMEVTGSFETSDPLVNQLQHNIQWGQRGNFLDVPTDCPQRNERLGWTGDAQVFVRTAAFNMDVAGFFTKWARDLRDAQKEDGRVPMVAPNCDDNPKVDGGPAWSDAHVICPWTIYLCYGDKRILEEHYDSAKRFIQCLEAGSVNLIRSHPDGPLWTGFGDWLALDGSNKLMGATPHDLIGTAFFHYSTSLVAKMARVLDNLPDAEYHEGLAKRIKSAFIRRYLTQDHLLIGQTQTAYVLALQFDLVPEESRPTLVKWLVDHIRSRGVHLATGFVGTSYLNQVLTREGELNLAYTLLHQKTWPSWLYAVTQGATTIWERWDGWTHDRGFQDPGMNSYNHYAYGAIGEWLYATVAGINLDPDRPAYKHSVLRPRLHGGFEFARATLKTAYGDLSSSWKIEGSHCLWDVVVPPNTTSTVYVPCREGANVTEAGQDVALAPDIVPLGADTEAKIYRLNPGSYSFRSSLPETMYVPNVEPKDVGWSP